MFVPGALPGETVEVEVVSAGRKHGRGTLVSIESPVDSRTEPRCSHFGTCGGCQLQHLDYKAQLDWKTEAVRTRLQHELDREDVPVLPCLGPDDPWGQRNRIALQVTEEFGQLNAGLYQRRSRRVVPIDECPVSDPAGLKVALDTIEAARVVGFDAWDPRTEAGTLRTVLARTNANAETGVTVVVRDKHRREIQELCENEFGATGLSINVNKGGQDRLLGSHTESVHGDEFTWEQVGDIRFRLAPAGWFRTSHFAAERVAETVRRFVDPHPQATVLDFYSGSGFFALTLARSVKRVIAIEENRRALADAVASAAANDIDNVEIKKGKVEEFLESLRDRYHAIVIDPPAGGCGRFVLNAITKDVRPERIVFVSQNPEEFTADVAVFTQRGYNLRQVQPIDAGPHTGSVETVALLEARIEKGKRKSSIAQARRLLDRVRKEEKRDDPQD